MRLTNKQRKMLHRIHRDDGAMIHKQDWDILLQLEDLGLVDLGPPKGNYRPAKLISQIEEARLCDGASQNA